MYYLILIGRRVYFFVYFYMFRLFLILKSLIFRVLVNLYIRDERGEEKENDRMDSIYKVLGIR